MPTADTIIALVAVAAAVAIALALIWKGRGSPAPPRADDPRYLPRLTPLEARHLKRVLPLDEGDSCYVQIKTRQGTFSTIHVQEDGLMVRYWDGGSMILTD